MTTTDNPGYLKLDLALSGLEWAASGAVPEDLRGCLDSGHIELLLPEDVIFAGAIGAAMSRPRSPDSAAPYQLVHDTQRYFVQRDRERTEVRVVPPPQFSASNTQAGVPMRDIGRVHGSFLVLAPLGGCGLSLGDGWCSACRANGHGPPAEVAPPTAHAITDVIDTVRAAFDEGAIEFVVFNHGGPSADDGGMAALEPYIRAVKRHFDTLVAVQGHPPAHTWIDRTYAMGVDSVSYSIGMHALEALKRACPGRAKERDRYYEALAHAAAIFPSGTVWTDLLLGYESAGSTVEAIDQLIQSGVIPIVSLATPDGDAAHPTLPEVVPIMAHLFHAARRAKINMGWVRDVSFGITPLEARFFVAEEARLSVVQQFYRSRLGGLTARNLARLRRRLRVRTVSDSFDSSHL